MVLVLGAGEDQQQEFVRFSKLKSLKKKRRSQCFRKKSPENDIGEKERGTRSEFLLFPIKPLPIQILGPSPNGM